jgi:hypothetical protein
VILSVSKAFTLVVGTIRLDNDKCIKEELDGLAVRFRVRSRKLINVGRSLDG